MPSPQPPSLQGLHLLSVNWDLEFKIELCTPAPVAFASQLPVFPFARKSAALRALRFVLFIVVSSSEK